MALKKKAGGWREDRRACEAECEEQRRLKGARRREKEHATRRKTGKGAAGSV